MLHCIAVSFDCIRAKQFVPIDEDRHSPMPHNADNASMLCVQWAKKEEEEEEKSETTRK